jgi:hypothetical protein
MSIRSALTVNAAINNKGDENMAIDYKTLLVTKEHGITTIASIVRKSATR